MSALKIDIEWEGRLVRLSYNPAFSACTGHVEVRSDDGEPLPITETGYRSHFFSWRDDPPDLAEVTEKVIAWFDEEACKPKWQSYLVTQKQLSLF